MELTQAALWHRQAAALVSAADRVGVAADSLPALEQRLFAQRGLLIDAMAAAGAAPDLGVGGAAPPSLVPTPADVAAAMPALGDLSAGAVVAALAAVGETLDAVDAALGIPATAPAAVPPAFGRRPEPRPEPSTAPGTEQRPAARTAPAPTVPAQKGPGQKGPTTPPPVRSGIASWPVPGRNAVVYAGFAAAVTVIQLGLLFAVPDNLLLIMLPGCLFVLPAFCWAAGWFAVGILFKAPPGEKIDRTPRLGLLISLGPNILLCGWLGVLIAKQFLG